MPTPATGYRGVSCLTGAWCVVSVIVHPPNQARLFPPILSSVSMIALKTGTALNHMVHTG
jgi:hypothetical protein